MQNAANLFMDNNAEAAKMTIASQLSNTAVLYLALCRHLGLPADRHDFIDLATRTIDAAGDVIDGVVFPTSEAV